ncbi:MAG: hypothetical protein HOD06_01200 [Candidatus Komeilibacteria bacterium]|jgi:hypothetical protein|nr:hypothetical protein [Candidatus Komeilibacteria bacterium]
MKNPESIPQAEGNKTKEFASWDELPASSQEEGLRPYGKYAGGDPDEIIIVAGIRYRKEIAYTKQMGGNTMEPATERDYFNHPGPGWDAFSAGYLEDFGFEGTEIRDPKNLSELILYRLEKIDNE